jgi:predicted nucleotidyltransferase
LNDKQTILRQIRQATLEVDPSAQLILFGSQARSETHEESDWDILVLTENEKVDASYKRSLLRNILKLELELGITISSVIRTKKNWEEMALTPFYQEVKKDGELIA